MDNPIKTWHIHIKGRVQGVGYRPLVYTIAQNLDLNGFVKNGSNGLHIEINCHEELVKKFIQTITKDSKPELAMITSVKYDPVLFVEYKEFSIIQEEIQTQATDLSLTPDFALCATCRTELADSQNNRFDYGFITCTNCGPRFSIIKSLAYERIHTSMSRFSMCASCSAEYNNPKDRRYFSQTNSCPSCGIQLSLFTQEATCLTKDVQTLCDTVLKSWRQGGIIAIKGIGGYLLTCDASASTAVASIRLWKKRPSKPFALMFPNLDSLRILDCTDEDKKILEGPSSPIVLIAKNERTPEFHGVCDNHDRVGVMIPHTPVLQVLLSRYQNPIMVTSGNLSHSPIIYTDNEALKDLTKIADYVVTNDREIIMAQDDSVVAFTPCKNQKIILRRARGMAPSYINNKLNFTLENSLAMGADLKSAFCLFKNNNIHISQYIGDLSDYETQQRYEQILMHYLDLLDIQVERILLDLHPNYLSTQMGLDLAKRWNIPSLSVQHHQAHFCALLGERALLKTEEKILGVIWDGSGLGLDGNIWGGEFFTYRNRQLKRSAHLAYSKHIAKDKMSREPRLSALALLGNSSSKKSYLIEKFSKTEWEIYNTLLEKEGGLLSSSMGRFFDAAASILGILNKQSYQGEAASLLEVKARMYFTAVDYQMPDHSYFLDSNSNKLNPQTVLEKMITDLDLDIPIPEIAAKFHLTLIDWIRAVAIKENCKKIGFSGGVFQNSLLVDLLIICLGKQFELLFHQELSPNDENIAFGQLIYASLIK